MSDGDLDKFDHLVVLMLENHSFDNMLGWLYSPANPPPYNHSPAGQPVFDGLGDGSAYSNPLSSAPNAPRKNVHRIMSATDPNGPDDSLPNPDPGEGYDHTNVQLFAQETPPRPPTATMEGFIIDYAPIAQPTKTLPESIMGCYDPTVTKVLSGLARSFAVCDRWFSSVPSQTWPNRRFAHAGTAKGDVYNTPVFHDMPTIFDQLPESDWGVFTAEQPLSLTGLLFPHLVWLHPWNFQTVGTFKKLAKAGKLPSYSFIEPRYFVAPSDQLPAHSVPAGEALIEEVYKAVVNGPSWERTLLVITYDEHGGCYDHVPPPTTAVPPDGFIGSSGFDFKRFGVRVPAVLVSPYIDAGTILRPPDDVVFDHTSIIKTLRRRFGITKPLTHRDDVAPSFEMVLSRAKPRTLDEVPRKFGAKGALQAKRAAAARADRAPLNELQRDMVQMAINLPPKGTRPRAKRLAPLVRESVEEVATRVTTQRAAEDYVVGRLQETAGRGSRRRGVPA